MDGCKIRRFMDLILKKAGTALTPEEEIEVERER